VELDLRDEFDRAVGDDPGVAPGEMARTAIAEGVRRRGRRRRLTAVAVAAGLVLAAGAATGLNVALGDRPGDDPMTVAAAMMPVAAAACTAHPVERDATDVVVFLGGEPTERQRAAVETALRADPRVGALVFESRAQAYERFRVRWKREPDFLATITAEQLPESFRLRLVSAAQYAAFRTQYATMAGVDQVIGHRCASSAPIGGLQ
jgi:hypothetical protein